MADDYDTLTVEVEAPVETIAVNRPEAMNAVNVAVVEELNTAVRTAVESEEVRVIVLTGSGERAFVGGGDIKEFSESSGIWFETEFRDAVRDLEAALEGSPKPIIAAVNGVALGGGTEIAMMCDLIVATESARFGQPEIRLGIIPGAGGTQRLTQLVGYLKAKELVLTGRHVPAREAADIGLVNEVVDDDEFDARVDELATELASGPPIAQRFAKRAVNEARPDLQSGLELEAALAALLFETEDKAEGMAAFVEKRDPEFSGRQ